MSKQKKPKAASPPPAVINWNPPSKKELVERAVSDGMTDASKIVAWASNYKVTMTVDEVRHLMAELKK